MSGLKLTQKQGKFLKSNGVMINKFISLIETFIALSKKIVPYEVVKLL